MKKNTGVFLLLGGFLAGGLLSFHFMQIAIKEKNRKIEKFTGYFYLLNKWISLKEKGRKLGEFFEENGYHTVGIYGMGYIGKHLYEELKDSDVKVKYGIDQNAGTMYAGLEIRKPGDRLPEADVIVVTPVYDFESIAQTLKQNVCCPVISLGDAVDALV